MSNVPAMSMVEWIGHGSTELAAGGLKGEKKLRPSLDFVPVWISPKDGKRGPITRMIANLGESAYRFRRYFYTLFF
jgi:hypothetical protein